LFGGSKGGLIVDVIGIEAFLPGSGNLMWKPIRDYGMATGKTNGMRSCGVPPNEFKKCCGYPHKALIEAEIELQKT
jgi:small subunit ribosomal protein S1